MPHNSTRLLANQSTVTTGTAGAGAAPWLAMFASANTLQQASAQSSGNQILFNAGTRPIPSVSSIQFPTHGLSFESGAVNISVGGTLFTQFDGTNVLINSQTGTLMMGTSGDAILARDGANILAMKNGANAQTQRWYGTTANNSFVAITHNGTNGIVTTSGGLFGFGTVTSSTGTNTASSPSPVTGFITITDSAGVSRKLLTGT
jgi:hypothetical protein